MSMPVEIIIDSPDEKTLSDSGFYWREHSGVWVLVCRELESAGFINAFSTRIGGVSPFPENSLNLAGFDDDTAENIAENRRRFLSALGVTPESALLATAWQVHSDNVKVIRSESEALDGNGKFDALTSQMREILVGVKTADCVPVLIGDAASKSFAAVHAGWRGTSLAIVEKAVRVLVNEFGASPDSMIAAIGPAAGPQHYEVGPEVIEALSSAIPDVKRFTNPTRDGHATINLPAINREQLINAGLREERVFVAPYCTMTRSDLFFSYRVDRKAFGRTGRLLSVIGSAV